MRLRTPPVVADIKQPPECKFPELENQHYDDFDYSFSQGTSSAGGGFLLICVIIIILGLLKFTGYI